MSREYVCGIIRDQLKRFLVVEYHLANSKKVASISAESWVSKEESPIDSLAIEFKNYFGIPSLNDFEIKHTKTVTRVTRHDSQNLTILLMDIRKPTTFRLPDDVAGAYFMPWDQLLNATKTKRIAPTVYSQCVADRLYSLKEIA